MEIKRSGLQPSQKGPAEHFTGSVRIDALFQSSPPARAAGAYVTFEPCARSDWHSHPLGQTLIVTGRVGVPHYDAIPGADVTFYKNVIVGGGPAPVRTYINELLPDVLEGRIEPGRVFDRTVGLDGVPDGYHAMQNRESIKVLVTP